MSLPLFHRSLCIYIPVPFFSRNFHSISLLRLFSFLSKHQRPQFLYVISFPCKRTRTCPSSPPNVSSSFHLSLRHNVTFLFHFFSSMPSSSRLSSHSSCYLLLDTYVRRRHHHLVVLPNLLSQLALFTKVLHVGLGSWLFITRNAHTYHADQYLRYIAVCMSVS